MRKKRHPSDENCTCKNQLTSYRLSVGTIEHVKCMYYHAKRTNREMQTPYDGTKWKSPHKKIHKYNRISCKTRTEYSLYVEIVADI